MIHEAFIKSEIARRYYEEKTGEHLTNEQARKRWDMTKNPDKAILKKVFDAIHKEQKANL